MATLMTRMGIEAHYRRQNTSIHAERAPLRDVVERLCRTIKCAEVFLRAYASLPDAWAGIGRYIAFFNCLSPH